MNGSISDRDKCSWNISSIKSKEEDQKLLETSQKSIHEQSHETKLKLELEFVAQNCSRKIGTPPIGKFSDRIKPESLHLEINSWQYILDIFYKEVVRCGQFK